MRTLIFPLAFYIGSGILCSLQAQSISITHDGSAPDSSAMLDVKSNNKGILIPRMDSLQRAGISNPAEGLLVYDLDTKSFWYYQNGDWVDLNTVNRVFKEEAGIVHNTGNHISDNFVFGSPQLNDDGNISHNARMFFNKDKRAFRAGSTRDTIDFIGGFAYGDSLAWQNDSTGYYSIAGGFNTKSSGFLGATSLGVGNTASGDHGATAIGSVNTASGNYGATALGTQTMASGNSGATALGYQTVASGLYGATAMGSNTKATGYSGTMALGFHSTAGGNFGSIAIGNNSSTSGVGSIAIGLRTRAEGDSSIVIGSGVYPDTLINSKSQSLMVGFNSNLPTLFIGPSNGIGTVGNVGIGTNTPIRRLHVEGGAVIDGNTLTVDESLNRVGIGTSMPEDKLHVHNGNILVTRGFINNTIKRSLTLKGAQNSMGNEYASIEFSNYDQIEWPEEGTTAKISSTNADGFGACDLRFSTFNFYTLQQRMIIAHDGKVGIGTNSPEELLHVSGGNMLVDRKSTTSGLTRSLTIGGARNGSGNAFAQMNFQNIDDNGNSVDYVGARISSENSTAADGGDLRFYTRDGTLQQRMRISHNGHIALNTDATRSLLTLSGPDNSDNGPIITLYGNSSDQSESGRIRFLEGTVENNWRGGYLHYDGSANRFHIGVHNTNDADPANDLNSISINRSTGYIGIGTASPNNELTIFDMGGNGDAIIRMKGTAGGTKEMVMGFNQSVGGILGTVTATNLTFRTNNTTRMTIEDTGNVGIGTGTPAYKLEVNGDINALGTVRCNGVSSCSDIRFKTDIQPIRNALRSILGLNGVYYFWDFQDFPYKNFKTTRDLGLIAQDVEMVIPELVSTGKEGYKSVDYSKLSAVLVEAIKEQQLLIEHQALEIAQLKTLETRLAELEARLTMAGL